ERDALRGRGGDGFLSDRPRVDYCEAGGAKWRLVAGCDPEVARGCNCGDLSVCNRDRTPVPASKNDEFRISFGGRDIECDDTILEQAHNLLLQRRCQPG